jgi:predicted GNAT family acetyltransferase
MSAPPPVVVIDNARENRFEATVDGALAGSAYYRRTGDRVVFTHTVVDPAWGGRGVGTALARGALDAVVASGGVIVARCPFIAAYVRSHPDYLSSVEPDDGEPGADPGRPGSEGVAADSQE